jgi:hypothetical protein
MKLAILTVVQLLTVLVKQSDGWNFVSLRPAQHRYSTGETVRHRWGSPIARRCPRAVYATSSSDPGGSDTKGTKKKRRRKVAPSATDSPSVSIDTSINGRIRGEDTLKDPTKSVGDAAVDDLSVTKEDLATLSEIAKFEFKRDTPTTDSTIPRDNLDASGTIASPLVDQSSAVSNNELLLPDIKEARKRKQMEEEIARQQAQAEQKVKIKRSDKEAMRKVSSRVRGAAASAAAHWCVRVLVSLLRVSSLVLVFHLSLCWSGFVWRNVCACVATRAAALCRCRRIVL